MSSSQSSCLPVRSQIESAGFIGMAGAERPRRDPTVGRHKALLETVKTIKLPHIPVAVVPAYQTHGLNRVCMLGPVGSHSDFEGVEDDEPGGSRVAGRSYNRVGDNGGRRTSTSDGCLSNSSLWTD